MSKPPSSGARTRARELLVQALYQKQIAGHELTELQRQFREQTAYARVEAEFFEDALQAICRNEDDLAALIGDVIDRPLSQLDPIELAILLIGAYELKDRIDVPYKVVINEGVNLARRFASTDGHKYINACLDKAAKSLRAVETGG